MNLTFDVKTGMLSDQELLARACLYEVDLNDFVIEGEREMICGIETCEVTEKATGERWMMRTMRWPETKAGTFEKNVIVPHIKLDMPQVARLRGFVRPSRENGWEATIITEFFPN